MKHHIEKVVCYVTRGDHLLVITHLEVPLTVTGVQVPAGTIELGEAPEQAALRELHEETGLQDVAVVGVLATDYLDITPTRTEVQHRHFVHLRATAEVTDRWEAGESNPSDGGETQRWECWWLPIQQAHVLAAAQSRFVHRLVD